MKPIFVNPQLLEKINQKALKISADWPNTQFSHIYQMVACIELGMTDRAFYHKNGIVFDGWNGYRHTEADRNDPDPYSAYNGFYRMEKNQMLGWSLYLIFRAETEEARKDQLSRCNLAYGLWLEWEPEPKVWGFLGFQDYYTEQEANETLKAFEGQPWVKRSSIEWSDVSWMWRVKAETTTKKPGLRHGWKARISA